MSFDKALAFTLRWEGGYVNHPADPGGATNKGVTQKVYDAWRTAHGHPAQSVKDITDAEVHDIYRDNYWVKAGCAELPEPLDLVQFDSAVNHGVGRAIKFLMQARGANPEHPVAAYIGFREAFYRDLAQRKPAMAVFLKGWLRRVDALREAVK